MSVGQGETGAGASDSGNAQAATVAALEASQGTPTGGTQPAQQQNQASELAQSFLKGVDPAHAEILKPYVSQWDAGVTKKFEEIHGEYKPYKELGDHQTLAQAKQLYDMIDNDPKEVFDLLKQALSEDGLLEDDSTQQQNPLTPQTQQSQALLSLPPELQQQWSEMQQKTQMMEQVLEHLAGSHLERTTQEQEAQEDAELDAHFTELKEKFGEFDEDYVGAKMMKGMSGEEAVQAYKTAIQGQVNSRSAAPNIPAFLGGGGSAPQDQMNISKASSKEVKALVADILAKSQQA